MHWMANGNHPRNYLRVLRRSLGRGPHMPRGMAIAGRQAVNNKAQHASKPSWENKKPTEGKRQRNRPSASRVGTLLRMRAILYLVRRCSWAAPDETTRRHQDEIVGGSQITNTTAIFLSKLTVSCFIMKVGELQCYK